SHADEVAWLAALLLFIAALHAYLSIRNNGARAWQERVAGYAFLGGVTGLGGAVLIGGVSLWPRSSGSPTSPATVFPMAAAIWRRGRRSSMPRRWPRAVPISSTSVLPHPTPRLRPWRRMSRSRAWHPWCRT